MTFRRRLHTLLADPQPKARRFPPAASTILLASLLFTACITPATPLRGDSMNAPDSATPATRSADHAAPSTLFFETQEWETGGKTTRLTLWADGRSESLVTLWDDGRPLAPGWQAVTRKAGMLTALKSSVLPPEEAQRRFRAALAAGFTQIRTFPSNVRDGGAFLLGYSDDAGDHKTLVPLFLHEGQPDDKGSDNHRRFLAVKSAIGDFDSDPFAPPLATHP